MNFPIHLIGLIGPAIESLAKNAISAKKSIQIQENFKNKIDMDKNQKSVPMEQQIDCQIISGLSILHENIIKNVIQNIEKEHKISPSKENEEIIHFLKIGADLLELKRKNIHQEKRCDTSVVEGITEAQKNFGDKPTPKDTNDYYTK